MTPNAKNFEADVRVRFAKAQRLAAAFVDVRSGDVHRAVGGYPAADGDHRMPLCCEVMKKLMKDGDRILPPSPPSGQGASLLIRYFLPR